MDNSLFHGIVALFTPIAWALILYPYCKNHFKNWTSLITATVGLSLLVMLIKELFDPKLSLNDVVADIVGIFFGIAFLTVLFNMGSRSLFKNAFGFNKNISLRDVLAAGAVMEERGRDYYIECERRISDKKAKEVSLALARDEIDHARKLYVALSAWLLKLPEPAFLSNIEKMILGTGVFVSSIPPQASEEWMIQYALEQERRMQVFYSNFEFFFPDHWKRFEIEKLVDAERDHEQKLYELLISMKESKNKPVIKQV